MVSAKSSLKPLNSGVFKMTFTLGLLIAFYVITKMLELERKENPKPSFITRLFAFITFGLALVSIATVLTEVIYHSSVFDFMLQFKK